VGRDEAWLSGRTTAGPATLRLTVAGDDVRAQGWGPGASTFVASVPDLLGFADDPSGFPAALLPDVLAPAWNRYGQRWRVPRSGLVLEALVAAVCEQKVTGIASRRVWRALLGQGEPAPGPAPAGMRVLPAPDQIARVPSWQWHAWGMEPAQSRTMLRAMGVAGRLAALTSIPSGEARARMQSVPGIGPWTAAEVAQRALGDADAVSVGDFHLPRHVVFAFTGEVDGTDEQMAEVLAPFAGHRYRVQRLVELAGIAPPKRGPRMAVADNRHR
jgi:3-methyladenine DNA glycosylase/8-oxoguanine DNA glycosylase